MVAARWNDGEPSDEVLCGEVGAEDEVVPVREPSTVDPVGAFASGPKRTVATSWTFLRHGCINVRFMTEGPRCAALGNVLLTARLALPRLDQTAYSSEGASIHRNTQTRTPPIRLHR